MPEWYIRVLRLYKERSDDDSGRRPRSSQLIKHSCVAYYAYKIQLMSTQDIITSL